MSTPDESSATPDAETEPLPFVAPCRILDNRAPLRWLALGFRDLRRAPGPSLTYGFLLLTVSYMIVLLTWQFANLGLLLGLLTGFVFLGPLLAVGLYVISMGLELGFAPEVRRCARQTFRHLGNLLIFAVVLTLVLLVWARAASMIHVFFPMTANPPIQDMLLFLSVGSAVGCLFAAVVFCGSAFSLPMLVDRKVDTITAVVTSVNAVLRNKRVMVIWAALIVAAVLVSFATAMLGLVIALPVIGHGTWHAYRETIDASRWPPVREHEG